MLKLRKMLDDDRTVFGQSVVVMTIPMQKEVNRMHSSLVDVLEFILNLSVMEEVSHIELYHCARAQGFIPNEQMV